jgi:MerR family transcriptional regulator, copper efflux regulator
MGSDLTIGRLAKTAGVNVQTVRYYERRKLLPPTSRMPSGYRLYSDEAEIAELLNLRVGSTTRCGDVKRKAQAKLIGVNEKVRDLQALARALRSLIETCQAGQPTARCPILNALEDEPRRSGRPRGRQ